MLRWLRAYVASDDPYVSACNTIAMVIAWNQPYYPFYLLWIVGRDAWVGIPDAFSGVLFFAVPAIIRRQPLLGKVAMVVLSVANVVFCSMMLGRPRVCSCSSCRAGCWPRCCSAGGTVS